MKRGVCCCSYHYRLSGLKLSLSEIHAADIVGMFTYRLLYSIQNRHLSYFLLQLNFYKFIILKHSSVKNLWEKSEGVRKREESYFSFYLKKKREKEKILLHLNIYSLFRKNLLFLIQLARVLKYLS